MYVQMKCRAVDERARATGSMFCEGWMFECAVVLLPLFSFFSPLFSQSPTLLTAIAALTTVTNKPRAVPTTRNVFRDVHPPSGSDRFMHCGSVQQLPKSCCP